MRKYYSGPNGGLSLLEVVFGAALALLIIIFIVQGFSFVSLNHKAGIENLEKFHSIRLAANYLRRDFRSAVPKIKSLLPLEEKFKLLKSAFSKFFKIPENDDFYPISVEETKLAFYAHDESTEMKDAEAKLEKVIYLLDAKEGCLVRIFKNKRQAFREVRLVKFELANHPLNERLSIIKVKLVATKKENEQKGIIEFNTTLSSSVSGYNLSNQNWRRNFD